MDKNAFSQSKKRIPITQAKHPLLSDYFALECKIAKYETSPKILDSVRSRQENGPPLWPALDPNLCYFRKQPLSKGRSFIVRSKRRHTGGLHRQLNCRQDSQASGYFDLHLSRCAV